MGWLARAVIIQKPVNRDSGPLPPRIAGGAPGQGTSLEHTLRGFEFLWRAWQKCGVRNTSGPPSQVLLSAKKMA